MYITEGDLENFILQDIDSSYSAWISSIIDMVGGYIDNYCGTDFMGGNAGEDRYFDGSGTNELYVGDFQAVTAVSLLDIFGNTISNLTENQHYFTYPLNQTVKNMLVLNGGFYGIFPKRRRAVKVTGTWGYGASNVPPEIKAAAIKLAAKLINEGLRGGQVKTENLGSYSITYKDVDEQADAMGINDILDGFRMVLLD